MNENPSPLESFHDCSSIVIGEILLKDLKCQRRFVLLHHTVISHLLLMGVTLLFSNVPIRLVSEILGLYKIVFIKKECRYVSVNVNFYFCTFIFVMPLWYNDCSLCYLQTGS